jgi:hypothetical protein
MTVTNPPDLGVIISDQKIRRGIYAFYVLAVLVAGALQVYFAATQVIPQPQWLTGALAVLAYLGVPIGGLALANTSNAAVAVIEPGE